jgi:hypothetical protein
MFQVTVKSTVGQHFVVAFIGCLETSVGRRVAVLELNHPCCDLDAAAVHVRDMLILNEIDRSSLHKHVFKNQHE